MCRFALYLGPRTRLADLLCRPDYSLMRQARHSSEGAEVVNADGCGVAWYGRDLSRGPALYRDPAPAWRSAALRQLGGSTSSTCILAHVRAAGAGAPVAPENCHPFTWRRLAFMHNGLVGDFDRLRAPLRSALSPEARRRVRGATDSEHVFALFTDHWAATESAAPLKRMAVALRQTIATLETLRLAHGIERRSFLNLAVSDGRRAVVSRFASDGSDRARSLYLRAGRRDDERLVVVASEPLSSDEAWQAVPLDHLVLVDETHGFTLQPLHAEAGRRVA